MSSTPSYHPVSEQALLQRVAAGDTQAFEILFHQYHPAVYTVINRITRSEELAEDLCQDCFLKIWLQRNQLPALENFTGWLHTVAANLTYDALRKRNADTLRNQRYGEAERELNSFTPTEKLLLEKEYANLVQGAINTLPGKQKEVFILIKQQGLSREEAATVLGVTPETVKSNLQAATQKLRAYCIARLGIVGALLLAWATR